MLEYARKLAIFALITINEFVKLGNAYLKATLSFSIDIGPV